MKHILIKDTETNEILKFSYSDDEVYKVMFKKFLEWEKLGKCEIIPQNINDFITNGVKE